MIFGSLLIHQLPQYWELDGKASPTRAPDAAIQAEKLEQIKGHVDEAQIFFNIGEKHFHATPPDFLKAEMAYSTAAHNGSLLAAYKLGYMYYNGEGTEQNDRLAFNYFSQATLAPLAFQPHNLEITTRYLAETYNNLGLMYQGGLGTEQDLREAEKMFRRGAEFGSDTARRNLAQLRQSNWSKSRKTIVFPDYR